MSKFTCPQCRAEVTKESSDELGCPCCGYAKEGSFAAPVYIPYVPYVPYTTPKWTEPTPWEITWGDYSDGTTVKPLGTYAVRFSCGQA